MAPITREGALEIATRCSRHAGLELSTIATPRLSVTVNPSRFPGPSDSQPAAVTTTSERPRMSRNSPPVHASGNQANDFGVNLRDPHEEYAPATLPLVRVRFNSGLERLIPRSYPGMIAV
jgi:hypothetical protein